MKKKLIVATLLAIPLGTLLANYYQPTNNYSNMSYDRPGYVENQYEQPQSSCGACRLFSGCHTCGNRQVEEEAPLYEEPMIEESIETTAAMTMTPEERAINEQLPASSRTRSQVTGKQKRTSTKRSGTTKKSTTRKRTTKNGTAKKANTRKGSTGRRRGTTNSTRSRNTLDNNVNNLNV